MTSTDTTNAAATPIPAHGEMHLEVVVLPVSDVDRAKQFYVDTLGFRLDADFPGPDGLRIVQVTPPGSSCSVSFGEDVTNATPGSTQDLMLAVRDIESCRGELANRGVDISEIFHDKCGIFHHAGDKERVSGPDPQRASYNSFASFSDPDGNGWMLQEITTPAAGPVSDVDVATLADLLHETADHHDAFEKATPPHNWWDWYAPYLDARLHGHPSDEASGAADRYMKEVRGVVRR